MLMVQCVEQGEQCLCLGHSAPPSLASALCNFSKRVGSQHYTRLLCLQHMILL